MPSRKVPSPTPVPTCTVKTMVTLWTPITNIRAIEVAHFDISTVGIVVFPASGTAMLAMQPCHPVYAGSDNNEAES